MSYFALFGVTFGTQGVSWAGLVSTLQLGKGVFGTAQLSAPLVSIFILLQAGPICNRVGKKRAALLGLLALSLAMAWMASAGDLTNLVLALALSGVGFGLIETAANAAVLDWEAATSRKVMNIMHAGFSGGAVLGAILGGALLNAGGTYRGALLASAGLAGLLFLLTLPIRYPPLEASADDAHGPAAALRLLTSGPVIIAMAVICLISTLGESVANIWSVIHLTDLGAPVAISGAAFALFNGTMFVGRLANATLVAWLGERASLIASGICLVLAGILLTTSTAIVLVTVAFALLGLAVAGVIPTVLSTTARLAPGRSGAVTGAIMSVAYLSFIVCPPLIGWVAEVTSLQAAFGLVIISGIVQLLLTRMVPATPTPANGS